MNKFLLTVSAAALALTASAGVSAARDQIQIAGSSTVLPYAKIVAENFGETFPNFKTPVVESGGSSAGLKEFCKGVGEGTIDIANASRKIKESEVRPAPKTASRKSRKSSSAMTASCSRPTSQARIGR